ncbi:MAG TPA: hypothetical protein DDZ76_01785 [Xanthomonadales bacterium]|nr:hypothetical protein [Xanthomonadales bacterium]
MDGLLSELRHELETYPQDRTACGSELGCLGIYRCVKPQRLSSIPLHSPCMMLVVTGCKHISLDNVNFAIRPGEMVTLPAGREFRVVNAPDRGSQNYHGMALHFAPVVLEQFCQIYGPSYCNQLSQPAWHSKAPESLIAELLQWLRWSRRFGIDQHIAEQRQMTMLLLLAQAGLLGNLLLSHEPSWRRRIINLVNLDPARSWGVQELCLRLGCSESSLRRHLQEEETSFREILEEVRLAAGLALLQQTYLQIGTIAERVGYQSQSRFGERFKRRFGITPSDLRRTRTGDDPIPADMLNASTGSYAVDSSRLA